MSKTLARPTCVPADKVWCPWCEKHVQLVRVTSAAKIVDVDRRTVYHYVKTKKVYGTKIAQSTTLRVCTSCLLQNNDPREYREPTDDASN